MKKITTLEDLRSVTHAYDDFRVIEECSIPDYYRKVFPHRCSCGSEMIMTEPGHTQLQCCNPCCWIKMGHRLSYFISSLGYKGFGEQSGVSLMQGCHSILPFRSFLAAFLLTDTDLSRGLNEYYVGLFKDIRYDIHERPFYFVDAIAALGIPNIGRLSTLFSVVKSPVVLLQYVLNDKTDELCEIAGIQAPMTRFHLKAAKVDILTLMKDVMPNIVDTPKREMYIAITGKVSVAGVQYSRYEFISLCEAIKDSTGAQAFKLVETRAESKVEYVIADQPSTSDKYRMGQRLNKLITADDFYALLQNRVSRSGTAETEVTAEKGDVANE